jgi:ornithine carbamoyltransferase
VTEATRLPKDFISIAEWPRPRLEAMLARARELRDLRRKGEPTRGLVGRSVLIYFEHPSLRTYVTFQVGISELGGTAIYLPPEQVRIGTRESVVDVAGNLSRWCHAVVARTVHHRTVLDLAHHASIPIVNALTDLLHPCQAMADALTIRDAGDPRRDRLVYIGDGNNVAHSLIHVAGRLGLRLTVCTPEACRPDPDVLRFGVEAAPREGGEVRWEPDPARAVADAAFIYTDVWVSMGRQTHPAVYRIFAPYQVNDALLRRAPAGARVLHCLPAHRGEEISSDVLDSPRSLVLEQAENRLHVQKAILEAVLSAPRD